MATVRNTELINIVPNSTTNTILTTTDGSSVWNDNTFYSNIQPSREQIEEETLNKVKQINLLSEDELIELITEDASVFKWILNPSETLKVIYNCVHEL